MSKLILKEWQQHAIQAFYNNDCSGIIVAPTGVGKTIVALRLIEQTFTTEKIIVIVPTISLMHQWKEEIKNKLNLEVGLLGDNFNIKKNLTIAVINTARDLDLSDYNILIIDEVHHSFSNENIKIFNFKFRMRLGLTATIDKNNVNKNILNIIYSYSQQEAINDNNLNKYDLINLGVTFNSDYQQQYEKYTTNIKTLFKELKCNINDVYKPPFNFKKMLLRKNINSRKKLLCNYRGKILSAYNIINDNLNNKIIIFCEFIETAEKLKKILDYKNINSCIYHSKIVKKNKEKILNDFKNNNIKILISVKALDEGINVPDANVAIIIANTKSMRQIIQRIGRVLRRIDGKKVVVYQLYIENTIDEDNVMQRTSNLLY